MNLVTPINRPPTGLAERLRELADMAERNELKDLVAAYTANDEHAFVYASSKYTCIVLSTLLQRECVDRMKA